MKVRLVLIFFYLFIFLSSQAQRTVSLGSVELGLLTSRFGYEAKLGKYTTLMNRAGFVGGISKGTSFSSLDYVFILDLSVEPRYYYSLNKRENMGRNTDYNAANYLGFTFDYLDSKVNVSNKDNVPDASSLLLIPKWGLRRVFLKRCYFEFGLGYIVDLRDDFQRNVPLAIDVTIGVAFFQR